MINYLCFDIESTGDEVRMKVEPIFGSASSKTDLQISTTDYIPSKGDKLYFLPGVNIPRVKLKDLTLEYGIKSIRNIDEATHIFAGNGTVHKICTNRWMYKMKTELFRQVYETVKDKMDDYYIENVDVALEFYTASHIFMEYSSANEIRNENIFEDARKIEGVQKSLQNSKTFYAVDEEYQHYFPTILNIQVLNDSTLLKYINGPDAVVIDSLMFDQLTVMFNSSDNDNHVLAMEIMSNSNYVDSLLYLEFLFKEHSNKMYNCHTKKHVNFKSLLGYLGKDSGMDTYIDDIMKSLIEKGVLDTDKMDIIMEKYSNEIEQSGGTDYFKVKTVTINESTLGLLNTNYVYNKVGDFEPEIITEEEEDILSTEQSQDLDDLSVLSPYVNSDVEIADEDIEDAFARIERNELKSELIALEESQDVSESELNKTPGALEEEKEFPEDESVFTEEEDYALGEMISKLAEEEPNNNQKNDTDSFEWF